MLEEYTETIEFSVSGGHRIVVPSDLDFALQRHTIQTQQDEQERLMSQTDPQAVKAARHTLREPGSTDAEIELAKARLTAYDARRDAELEMWRTAEWRTLKRLERMEGIINGETDLSGERSVRRFQMVEFSRKLRFSVDDKHTVARETQDGQTEMSIAEVKRNDELASCCLLGEWKPLGKEEVVKEGVRVKTFDGERFYLEPIEDVTELQDRVAAILIDRMWAYNSMSSELLGFFGKRPKP